ncbi:MAG: hypothetical protein V1779_16880 [bacterium]
MNLEKFLEFIADSWIYFATIFGLYFGLRYYWHDTRSNKANYIFNHEKYENDTKNQIELKKNFEKPWKSFNSVFLYHHIVHGGLQFVFNFMGGFFGWICLYIFARKNLNIVECGNQIVLDWSDLFLFVFAFLGLSGFLPQTLHSITNAFSSLLAVLTDKLVKGLKEIELRKEIDDLKKVIDELKNILKIKEAP